MDNIKVTVEHGNVSDTLKDDILKTFLRRIENIAPGTFSAHIVINPNLSGWNVESLSGNAKRYIIDDDNIVDDETRIRLATLKVNNTDFSLLYIFEKLLNPIYMPTNIHKNAGITSKNGRNDAKRLNINVVTVTNDDKMKKRKTQ